MPDLHPSATYTEMASRTSGQVIASYSSSFSLATRLLSPRIRQDIRNLYAVVRIADEIVDGAAPAQHKADLLAYYRDAVLAAPRQDFHTDPVLHAYACTARECNINPEHMGAFFDSMQMDLCLAEYSGATLQEYIYGSAEVIGLMCLAIFLKGQRRSDAQMRILEDGARNLGGAFQRINFLRDMGQDVVLLGRRYLPVDEQGKAQLVAQIRGELAVARAALPFLPCDVVIGVDTSLRLFSALTDRIDALPAAEIHRRRIRISTARKFSIAGCVVFMNLIRRPSLLKGTLHVFGN